ncbi:PTS IIA-like nitrogen regulatory protein PtsN [Parahaliea mediterranea]|uniref:PTS IIA-like nitrogen regulatory protein PtsN n=1 Tax=Parahaliea mediterranea TaxID=651086 RepID=A0A939DC43_9GAMM|nr:PTS IIA-like nitrogen regulatory protein PtsN [Parahaliea mediterranea]MBN7795340.1 PTS IIA-like nitrogen regulatory protein PtsN [Parahaliea mediterranea]
MQTLSDILTPGRTVCRATGGSKKRLFETIARLISEDQQALSYTEVFTQLIARERLGSTGLGKGIAIPHCRIDNCPRPLGSLLTLEEAIDFEAPDGEPVDLLFVLLVPEEAQQVHLDILSHIAGLFRQDAFCQSLRQAEDAAALYATATTWTN